MTPYISGTDSFTMAERRYTRDSLIFPNSNARNHIHDCIDFLDKGT